MTAKRRYRCFLTEHSIKSETYQPSHLYLLDLDPGMIKKAALRLSSEPDKDRFNSQDLHQAFQNLSLTLTHTFELKRMGILGVGVKAEAESISCKRHEDACHVVLE